MRSVAHVGRREQRRTCGVLSRAAVAAFGGLDILVNNAGICPLSPFAEISEAEWDRVLAVNLKGAFLCCQAALPHLRQAGRRGRIINIASVGGQMGGVLVGAHYAASKAGLIGLTKSLAKLLAPDGVTVNCVSPATTSTDLTAAWSDEMQARVRAQIPLGPLRRAGRDRRGRLLPGERRSSVHHRRDAGCEWRVVFEVVVLRDA